MPKKKTSLNPWEQIAQKQQATAVVEEKSTETATLEMVAPLTNPEVGTLVTPENMTPSIGAKIFIFGKEKVGKSIFAASSCLFEPESPVEFGLMTDKKVWIIPKGSPAIILDTENGAPELMLLFPDQFNSGKLSFIKVAKTITKTNSDTGQPEKHTNPVASFDKFEKTFRYLIAVMKEGTIIIDSISSVSDWLYQSTIVKANKKGKDKPDGLDWAWRAQRWESLMYLIEQSNINIIATCKVKREWDVIQKPDDDRPKLQPTGDMRKMVMEVTPYKFQCLLDMYETVDDNLKMVRAVSIKSRGIVFQPEEEEILRPNFAKVIELMEKCSKRKPKLEF